MQMNTKFKKKLECKINMTIRLQKFGYAACINAVTELLYIHPYPCKRVMNIFIIQKHLQEKAQTS